MLPGVAQFAHRTIRLRPEAPAARIAHAVRAIRSAFRSVPAATGNLTRKPGPPIEIAIRFDSSVWPQGYRLQITTDRVELSASSPAGFRYAAATLQQLLEAGAGAIRCMQIDDWPDFAHRGVMLDISRDKVPTMKTLRDIVDRLARWKINELQLYTEHTFAYRGHEAVWRNASPMTPAQVRSFDKYCSDRGIELVPNQNSFGHMERWLKHPAYRDLAETQEGWKSPWGDIRTQATTLNPLDRRSIKLVSDLYDQLLPCFTSRRLNVGCDETFELGQGRSKAACEKFGVGRVYFDFLMKIHKLARKHGRQMQFWADIVQQHPELVAELPDDVIPLVWGYEADSPFDDTCSKLAKRGLDFYVCPGTSSWCSFSGRSTNCIANLRAAATVGLAHGASGFLVTDWGDYGHRQYLPVSWLGLVHGAALGWCVASNRDLNPALETSRHAFDDPTGLMGELWHEAGRVHEPLGINLPNKTALFRVMHSRFDDPSAIDGLTPRRLDDVNRVIQSLRQRARSIRANEQEMAEFRATLDVLEHAVHRTIAMLKRSLPGRNAVTKLQTQIKAIISTHRSLWLARNRRGGLKDSIAHYARNLAEYEGLAGNLKLKKKIASGR